MIGTADDGVSHGRITWSYCFPVHGIMLCARYHIMCMLSCHVHDIMAWARDHVMHMKPCPAKQVKVVEKDVSALICLHDWLCPALLGSVVVAIAAVAPAACANWRKQWRNTSRHGAVAPETLACLKHTRTLHLEGLKVRCFDHPPSV